MTYTKVYPLYPDLNFLLSPGSGEMLSFSGQCVKVATREKMRNEGQQKV